MPESAASASSPSPTTEFNLLGPLTVLVDASSVRLGGPRQVAVLGRLVLSPGLVVSMDDLVDAVWDGDSPSRPDVAIRSYVSNLRRLVEPDRDRGDRRSCIESSPPGYRLVVAPEQLDSHRFEALLAEGRTALGAGAPAAAERSFAAAKGLWRGEPCEGLLETDALLALRSRLAEQRLTMLELSCEARLALGEPESAIADLEAAIALHPLRERLTELAMLALYRAGRQSDALGACRELHTRLIEKLGVTPGRPIQDLEHRILTHDPELLPATAEPERPAQDTPPGADGAGQRTAAGTGVAPVAEEAATVPLVDLTAGADRELPVVDVASPAEQPPTSPSRDPGLAAAEAATVPPVIDVGTVASVAGEAATLPVVDVASATLAEPAPPVVDVAPLAGEGVAEPQAVDVAPVVDVRLVEGGGERPVVAVPDSAETRTGEASDANRPEEGEGSGRGSRPHVPFAGREQELAALATVDERLAAGRGSTVLVSGEPGIGKTTLVATYCSGLDGVATSWGRCRPVATAEPLWPWGQLLDGLAPLATPEVMRGLERVGTLAPMLGGGRHPERTSDDPTTFFRPVVEVLRRISAETPIVLVIDDAHWADPSSLDLLSFASTALADRPVVFFVTWRHTERQSPVSALRALARLPKVVRLELAPLDRSAVEALVAAMAVGGRTLARRVFNETTGHPLFVRELLVGLTDRTRPTGSLRSPAPLQPTANIRDAVLDRIEQIHPATMAVATAAAVHGGPFDTAILAEVVETTTDVVDDVVDGMISAELLVDGGSGDGGHRFVHPIVAKTLLAELSTARRSRLHAALGHALWRRGRPPLELARHFARVGSVGTSILAARLVVDAVRAPMLLADLPELEEIAEQGLDAVEGVESAEALTIEVALTLAHLSRLRGRESRAGALVDRALASAERSRDRRLLALAVLGSTGGPLDGPSFARASFVDLRASIDIGGWAAKERTDDGDHVGDPIARLDAWRRKTSAVAEPGADHEDPGLPPEGEAAPPIDAVAVLRLRRLGLAGGDEDEDAAAFDRVLGMLDDRGEVADDPAMTESANPTSAGDRVAVAAELAATVLAVGASGSGARDRSRPVAGRRRPAPDRVRVAVALSGAIDERESEGRQLPHERLLAQRLRILAAFEAGDGEEVLRLRSLDPVGSDVGGGATAVRTPVDLDRISVGITTSLALGRLAEVEHDLGLARSRCHRAGIDVTSFDLQLLMLRREEGKFGEIAELTGKLVTRLGAGDHAVLAAMAAAGQADADRARGHLEALLGPGQGQRRRGQAASSVLESSSLGTACLATAIAHRLGDKTVAKLASTMLLPQRGSVAAGFGGLVLIGPVAHYAGLAAATLGKRKQARQLIDSAEDLARRAGADPWLRRALAARAALAASDNDRDEVDSLKREVEALTSRLGITGPELDELV